MRNPHRERAEARVEAVLPLGWRAAPKVAVVELGPGEEGEIALDVAIGEESQGRMWFAVDVTVGDLRLGQHAEALVDVSGAS